MDVVIESFSIERDGALYVEGDTDAFRQSFPGIEVTGAILDSIRESMMTIGASEDRVGFTAIAEHPVGFIVLSKSWFYTLPQGYIESMYVRGEARNTGIGKALIHRAFEHCKKTSCMSVRLDVSVSNSAAVHLYESVGFTATRLQMEQWVAL